MDWPGKPQQDGVKRLAGKTFHDLRPLRLRRRDGVVDTGPEALERHGTIEKVQPIASNNPISRVASQRDTAGDRRRIVPPEARNILLSILCKGGEVAFIVETPDYPLESILKFGPTNDRRGICKVGHRVVAANGETRVKICHNSLGDRGGGGTR